MTISELSIRRHVLAVMANLTLVLFGVIAFQRIGVDRFPPIEFPIVSVTTVLPGANPDIVDASITGIIESAVNSIPGIDFVQSTSSPGVSNVTVTFLLSKNIDVAFTEVQSKVNQVLRQLPRDIEPPVVQKLEVGASPVMWLSLQGDRTLQQLNQYARNVVKKRLETIDGVGQILLGGERRRTIRVELDLDRMAALSISPGDIRAAFASEHVQFPGGFLVDRGTEQLIKLDLEFHSAEALGEMVVRFRDGAAVRLRDIAHVEDGLADMRQIARFNGTPTVGIGIVKVSNANTVAVVDEVQRRLDAEIRPQLPPGMTLKLAVDQAGPIREIVKALQEHLVEGTLLAALVVWLFLRSFRSTLIIALSIPVSLLGAVAVMYFLGYTFNVMTLLALLLLIGVVVDDSIVVLENIFRHREDIEPDAEKAAINGTRQVVFAVTAASLTLVSIFAAVLFLGGIIGRFFESFAVVVTVGVLASLFVSLTLTPMLCSRYLTVSKKHGRVYTVLERVFERMDTAYARTLRAALTHRWKVVAITLAVVASSAWFFAAVDKEFSPEEDEGRFVINFRAPLGTGIEHTDRALRQIEALLADKPEVATYFSAIGLGAVGQVNRGIVFVRMVDRSERSVSQQALIRRVRGELAQIPGVLAFASPPSIVSGQRGEPLQFAVVGPDLAGVGEHAQKLLAALQEVDGMGRLDLDVQLDLPQVDVGIDRIRTAELGLSASDVAFAVNMLAGGVDLAKFNDDPGDGERYDIRVKAADGQLATAADLRRIYLRAEDGALVRFDTVAEPLEILGPAVITRLELQYSALYFGTPTMPLGDAVTAIFERAAEILPLGYQVRLIGQAREFEATTGYIAFAFGLALVLVFMVLASQFNSLVQPLIVMVAQPLAVIGGLLALWLTGMTLNIFSMIGMVLLIGLVAKNSILLVDLANQLRTEGRGVDEALLEACPIRLRPVLMTSLTVVLALTPAALGLAAGADTNAPLAVAVIGGMISSTLLTLVVVPAVYSLVESAFERRQRRHVVAVTGD